MCGQNGRCELESIDQETAYIVGRVIDRSHHFVAAFFAQPTGCSLEERAGDVAIVDALEEAKTADVCLMQRIVVRIIARHDAANDFTVSPGEK